MREREPAASAAQVCLAAGDKPHMSVSGGH